MIEDNAQTSKITLLQALFDVIQLPAYTLMPFTSKLALIQISVSCVSKYLSVLAQNYGVKRVNQ